MHIPNDIIPSPHKNQRHRVVVTDNHDPSFVTQRNCLPNEECIAKAAHTGYMNTYLIDQVSLTGYRR